MTRLPKRLIFVLLALCAGCTPSVPPVEFNPVREVVRPYYHPERFDTGRSFDVGIAFLRRAMPFVGYCTAEAHVAFAINNAAAFVDSASLDTIALIKDSYDPQYTFPAGYWVPWFRDSVQFSYSNFDNHSFTGSAPIAARFGIITMPRTISISKGCTIKYEGAQIGDSIKVSFFAIDAVVSSFKTPDTGAIVIRPDQLPPIDSGGGRFPYSINLFKERWAVMTSGTGKRIAVYSNITTYPDTAIIRVTP